MVSCLPVFRAAHSSTMRRRMSFESRWVLLAAILAVGCSSGETARQGNEAGASAAKDSGAPPQADARDRDAGPGRDGAAGPLDSHTADAKNPRDALLDLSPPDAAMGKDTASDVPGAPADRPSEDANAPDRTNADTSRDQADKPDANLAALTVYIAGDSTVSNYDTNHRPQAGWGQMLPELFTSKVTVVNKAIGGRTARRFVSEGRLEEILKVIKPGDYLLVQFGTNDSNKTATYSDGMPYYAAPADFKTYMAQYVTGARAKQAIPVMVTPPPRRSCDMANDSKPFGNGTGAYATAMIELGASMDAPVVDLNGKTLNYLNGIGCAASAQVFLVVAAGQYTGAYANGASDGTHFQEFGARKLAGFVAAGVKELDLGLAAYLK